MLARRVLLLCVACGAGFFAFAGAAGATPATEVPCTVPIEQFQCLTVTVPLSHSGALPGDVRVQAMRLPAQEGPRLGTLVVVAGGPGQSSTSVLSDIYALLQGADRYDIVAIDMRGTGYSEPLNCLSLDRPQADPDVIRDAPITGCANDIGAARATYTTAEAAADMDDVRAALGVDQWTLFGVSYGTKLAMAYASAYPTHTKAVLLDSVLPVDQPGPFDVDSLAAMRRSLDEVCRGGRCKSFLPDPVASTYKLVRRLERRPLADYRDDGLGGFELVKATPVGLYDTFYAADFNQFIYEQMPGAVASALRGDDAGLLRIQTIADSGDSLHGSPYALLLPKRKRPAFGTDFSDALFLDTTCEDLVPPWPRGAALGTRQPAIDAAANAIPAADYLPFNRDIAQSQSEATLCRGWPESNPQPVLGKSMPDVPTLILDGSLDVRTPYAWAQQAAALFPHAQLVEVPNVGHSTTGTDMSDCAASLARRFLIYGHTSGKCRRTTPPVPVQKPAPTALQAVSPLHGKCKLKRSGKGTHHRSRRASCRRLRQTITAGYLALRDAVDQLVVGGLPYGPGLRAGEFSLDMDEEDIIDLLTGDSPPTDAIRLDDMSQVPGISISGVFRFAHYPRAGGNLRIYDESGHGWRVHIGGLLGYAVRDDRLRIVARSKGKRVALRTGLGSIAQSARLSRPLRARRTFGFGLTRP